MSAATDINYGHTFFQSSKERNYYVFPIHILERGHAQGTPGRPAWKPYRVGREWMVVNYAIPSHASVLQSRHSKRTSANKTYRFWDATHSQVSIEHLHQYAGCRMQTIFLLHTIQTRWKQSWCSNHVLPTNMVRLRGVAVLKIPPNPKLMDAFKYVYFSLFSQNTAVIYCKFALQGIPYF